MLITKELESEISGILNNYWDSYINGDLVTWASYLPDHYRNIGTTEAEVWHSKQEIVDYTNKVVNQLSGMAEIRDKKIEIIPYDPYLMVHEFANMYLKTETGWSFYSKLRLSSLLENTSSGWKILHQHGSFPDAHAETGETFAFEILNKENSELRDAVKRRTAELEIRNREAQIELALERVRARTMAMQHSDELTEVSFLLDNQIRALGIKTRGCAFNIYGENESTEWFSSEMGSMPAYKTPRENLFLRYYEAGLRGDAIHVESFAGQACIDHYNYLATLPGMDAVRELKAKGLLPSQQTDQVIYFKYGYLLFITLEPAPEAHDIFIRFAKVFEQTYTRFLDLQKAEEQTKEAKIEATLERVRARTMAMQHSDELTDAATVLFRQIENLGAPSWNCGFNIWDEDKKFATTWNGSKDGLRQPFRAPSHEDVFFRFYQAAQKGEALYVEEMGGETLINHYAYLRTLPGVGNLLADFDAAGISLPGFQVFHAAYFSQGYLLFITYEPVPQLWDTFKRFAKVFEQTYTRFLDLKKAEAQAIRAEQDLVEIKAARKKAEDTLTELQFTQKQLIQAEKMASLGELTAGIAHEIQNPLNFVNNFSEVSNELMEEILEEIAKGNYEDVKLIVNDVKQNLEKINHHGKRADGIVKGMLQHSRTSSGLAEPTDINSLADEYLRLAYHGIRAKNKSFNASLKTDFDESIGAINIIPQDIGRVLLNLITNAFYAVQEKQGNATVQGYKPAVSISTKKSGDKVLITVADNGNGIPKNIIDKIFQPFFTTKPTGQGTGLGLSLAYDIAKAHGGELLVETKEGEGTVFIIQLPHKTQ